KAESLNPPFTLLICVIEVKGRGSSIPGRAYPGASSRTKAASLRFWRARFFRRAMPRPIPRHRLITLNAKASTNAADTRMIHWTLGVRRSTFSDFNASENRQRAPHRRSRLDCESGLERADAGACGGDSAS